jgi:hypothetical protein
MTPWTGAFTSVERFEEMRDAWLAVQSPTLRKRLRSYLRSLEPVVRPQMERRYPWPKPEHPHGTGALEQHLTWLRRHITHRVGVFTNRERLNRMLLLMTLKLNGFANEREYAEHIRAWLLANGGHPRVRRREVTDPQGRPSLRP